jgi:hypothetical protein
MDVPHYFLMVTQTAVQLSLHITKKFFGAMILVFFLLLINRGQAGLL